MKTKEEFIKYKKHIKQEAKRLRKLVIKTGFVSKEDLINKYKYKEEDLEEIRWIDLNPIYSTIGIEIDHIKGKTYYSSKIAFWGVFFWIAIGSIVVMILRRVLGG